DWLAQLAFPLPAGGDSAIWRSGGAAGASFFGLRGIVGGAGLARAARRFLACRRRSGGAGRRIFFGLHGIAGRDGIGSHCSPFPCLPAASLQEPEMPKGYFFILACSFG
ncbi:hypothetical protein, partial [Alistipes sp.]|uniref:hypothetical protein n=1 Tax=Alistipes sp. TaxID=1872444 RepID=UPI003AB720E8